MTVQEILNIKAGETLTVECETPLAAKSGQSRVSYVKKFRRDSMPEDVADYTTTIVGSVLTISAKKKED
jgi:hypothetical protein